MSKRYTYQYVCFDIRDKEEIDLANTMLEKLAYDGYDLEMSVTENRNEGMSDIRLNKLRKEIK